MSDWGTTERVDAQLIFADGTTLSGEMHMQVRVAYHDGPETPLEMLNRPEAFFALSLAGGVAFISKAQVAVVSCGPMPPPLEAERASAARQIGLDVLMANGDQHRGWTSLELPPPRARPLDYLNMNSDTEPFFTVSTETVTCYINRAHVRLVRPLD
jgi:hypothetical protein